MLLLLDSYFARVDTANPDSGERAFPKRATTSRITTARLELDDTKPGSKRKTEREVIVPRPHLRRGTCYEGWKPFPSPAGRAFAFHAAFIRLPHSALQNAEE